MSTLIAWLQERLEERPLWMNLLMVFCAFVAYVYIPYDFFIKPVSEDREVWFGLAFEGRAAKITEPLHFLIYAAGAYGFWRMRPWMWPWAPAWAGAVAFAMFVWPIAVRGGFASFLMGIVCAAPAALAAYALWDSRYRFAPQPLGLRQRYGEWAVITGASAGIGAEFARALAREGLSCVLAARREERLRELAEELESRHGVATRTVAVDLASADGPGRLAGAVEDLDVAILVNNAGVGYAGRFDKQDGERLRELVDLNCAAPVALTHRLLPGMLERGRGAIVMVASVAGRQPLPLHGVYAASKAFDLLLGEALWAELRGRGVDVTVLMPGPVASEFEEASGETRPDPAADEQPDSAVRIALEALGRQPSVVSGTWWNWVRANVNRFLPRAVVACVASDFTAKQTPPEMR